MHSQAGRMRDMVTWFCSGPCIFLVKNKKYIYIFLTIKKNSGRIRLAGNVCNVCNVPYAFSIN